MGWNRNEITEKLGIDYPIFQAPMAGGITTAELISETSNCGGLGNLGAGYMKPDEIREITKKIRCLTDKSFGVNLFVPNESTLYKQEDFKTMARVLAKYQSELGIEESSPHPEKNYKVLYENQLEEVLRAGVSVCSFTFGIPDKDVIRELKQQECIIIGTATNVNEAMELEESGVDMIVAQGSEAGGHRGTYHDEDSGLIGSMALIPQVVDAVSKPVIAAGGIMDARGIAAAMILGAEGVQLGTAFLTCKESGAHPIYKEALLNSTEEQTVLTKSFSGKLARGINNRFIKEMSPLSSSILPFPIQNDLTGSIRKQAAKVNQPDFMSLWAGQGLRLANETTVYELMKRLIEETEEICGSIRI
ncbi:nitronate monooxygenase [Bacillus sp. FJAT-29790]|uniref:NAD(P)H-dependent flavin oxidoreductase n=1 Tax=Bacillus sp. FJAT-29790 TaxID=1895002 RepID=UPI001C216563|nr:nitronate monooxygenase [Bacillus sp. FJAT-29790]MBU8880304.1 nitronate monooxygenase [Bacillus sp. FJAT-29790]